MENATTRLLYPLKKAPIPILQKTQWASDWSGWYGKSDLSPAPPPPPHTHNHFLNPGPSCPQRVAIPTTIFRQSHQHKQQVTIWFKVTKLETVTNTKLYVVLISKYILLQIASNGPYSLKSVSFSSLIISATCHNRLNFNTGYSVFLISNVKYLFFTSTRTRKD
jgi:hypothetical protein